jgi:hypothetical protein
MKTRRFNDIIKHKFSPRCYTMPRSSYLDLLTVTVPSTYIARLSLKDER